MKGQRILVVDDSAADRAALKMAFAHAGPPVTLAFAESARDALSQLRASDAPRPQLMLIDVHMPGASGLDLLAELKNDKRLREIPVFMLSGSQDRRDVDAAYRGQASGFMPKPKDFEGLRRLAELMARLCVEALEFPDRET
jgi:CheY-like chemotaxis protein